MTIQEARAIMAATHPGIYISVMEEAIQWAGSSGSNQETKFCLCIQPGFDGSKVQIFHAAAIPELIEQFNEESKERIKIVETALDVHSDNKEAVV